MPIFCSQMELSEGILAHVIIPKEMDDSFVENEDEKSCLVPGMSDDTHDKEFCLNHEVKGEVSVMNTDQNVDTFQTGKDTTVNDGDTSDAEETDEEEKKPHICQYCYLAFSDLEEFMDHMEIHEAAEEPTTDGCDVKCEQHDVDQHLEAHDNLSVPNTNQQNSVPGIKVEHCEYTRQMAHALILNTPPKKFASHSTGSFACSCVCCKTFDSIEKFQKHSIVHGPHNCKLCGKTFKRRNLLNKHLLVHSDAKPLKCDLCGEGFRKYDALKKHKLKHAGVRPHQCDICDKSFYLRYELTKHKEDHSGIRYECKLCSKTFTREDSLKGHMQSKGHVEKAGHNSDFVEKPYQCQLCGKSFHRKLYLTDHLKIHSGLKPHSCTVCGKAFLRKRQMNDHMRIHTGEKPFICDQCGKGFICKSDLTKHLPVHSDKKPHQCTECDKSFIRKYMLDIHMRSQHDILTEEDMSENQCEKCGKSFVHKSLLAKHRTIHVTPYECKVCGKKFSTKRHLTQHMPKHTGEKSFQCNLCGKSFGHNSSLSNHRRKSCKMSADGLMENNQS